MVIKKYYWVPHVAVVNTTILGQFFAEARAHKDNLAVQAASHAANTTGGSATNSH